MSRLAGEPEPPSHEGVAGPSIAPLLVASALLLFPGPFLVGACCLAAWWLVPAAGGRGRVVKALAGPAVGGWLGLLGLMWFAGKSPLLGSLNAQAALLASFVCSGLAPPSPDLLQQWLVGSWALGVGLGPSLALLVAWRIARRPREERVPDGIAARARAGAVHPPGGVLLGFTPDGRDVALGGTELSARPRGRHDERGQEHPGADLDRGAQPAVTPGPGARRQGRPRLYDVSS